MKATWAIVGLLTLTAASVAAMAAPSGVDRALPPAAAGVLDQVPANDRARGLVFDGLSPGRAGTLCEGLFELRGNSAEALGCTHGPDAAPAEADVAQSVPPASAQAIAEATPIQCPAGETGTSGMRVQAIYAYEQGQPNRYATYAASFPVYAGNVEATYADSAAQTGGVRHVRWVTDSQCKLDVKVAALPAGSLESLSSMRAALQAMGYSAADRKYLVWADANVYCGIGYFYHDDSPQGDGTVNANDGKYAMYSRVDNGCWGFRNSVEAHELMHNLGGVQASARHATAGAHCVDNADLMCYDDGELKSGQVLLTRCASTEERFLDCGDDDYYSTSPAAGSYLATHWNAASSRFLFQTTSTQPPPPPPPPPPQPPTSSSYAPTFQVASGSNTWWVEVRTTAPAAKVEADAGKGWVTLPATSWGAFAKSFHVAKGTPIQFRATSAAGEVAVSKSIPWLMASTADSQGASTAPPSFTATFTPKAVGNDWWVETSVQSSQAVTKVEAKVGSGAWTALPATNWGAWAKSIHAPNGSQVQFRAYDASGATATSPVTVWT